MPEDPRYSGILSKPSLINLILLCIGFLLAVGILLIESLTSITVVMAATIILAYLLMSPVAWIEHRLTDIAERLSPQARQWFSPELRKTLAILLVYLLFFVFAALAAFRIAPALLEQIKDFAHEIPHYLSQLEASHAKPQANLMAAPSSHLMQKLALAYSQYASKLGSYLLDIGTSALSGLVYSLTALVLVFIILQDGVQLKNGFIELMPNQAEAFVAEYIERLHKQAERFIKAQALMSLLGGGMMYLLLSLLDLKYALLLGVFFGLVSILPVMGPWIGLLAIVGFVAFSNHPVYIIAVLLYAGVFYLLKTYWLWPQLIDKKSDIHPVVFLITFVACFKMVGFLGILLSFPLSSIISVTFNYLQSRHEEAEAQTQLQLHSSING